MAASLPTTTSSTAAVDTGTSNGHYLKSALKCSKTATTTANGTNGHPPCTNSSSTAAGASPPASLLCSLFSFIGTSSSRTSSTSSSSSSSSSSPSPTPTPSPSPNTTSAPVINGTSRRTSSRPGGLLLQPLGTTLRRSKYYLSSLRPGSFLISLLPVLLGALLAVKTTGQFSFVILGATVLTVLSVHAAGNLVNTYCDFIRGIDSKERRSDDRTLVDGVLTPEEVVNLGVIFYVIGCIGFLIVVLTSPARMELLALMYFGGISSSFLYTGGGLKYIALGDVLIMITFGPVSVLYSFIAQTGTIRLITLLYALPLALNAEAILHSNNTRDIEDDRKAGCVTIAVLIGHSASHVLFALLLFTPYILFMVCAFHYSFWLLLPMITLPKAFQLERQFRDGNLQYLPQQMGRLNFYFGAFYLLACFSCHPQKLPGLYQF